MQYRKTKLFKIIVLFIDFIASIVIDGEFLTAPPEEMLSTGNYKTDINLLASIVEDEYSFNMHSLGMAEFAPKTPAWGRAQPR